MNLERALATLLVSVASLATTAASTPVAQTSSDRSSGRVDRALQSAASGHPTTTMHVIVLTR